MSKCCRFYLSFFLRRYLMWFSLNKTQTRRFYWIINLSRWSTTLIIQILSSQYLLNKSYNPRYVISLCNRNTKQKKKTKKKSGRRFRIMTFATESKITLNKKPLNCNIQHFNVRIICCCFFMSYKKKQLQKHFYGWLGPKRAKAE